MMAEFSPEEKLASLDLRQMRVIRRLLTILQRETQLYDLYETFGARIECDDTLVEVGALARKPPVRGPEDEDVLEATVSTGEVNHRQEKILVGMRRSLGGAVNDLKQLVRQRELVIEQIQGGTENG